MKFLVVLLSLALIPFSHAATLKGTNGVELLAIDGQKIKVGMLQNRDIEVSEGKHQIVVQFAKRIKQDGMVYSRPHIFSIDVKNDTEISTKRFSSKTQAEYAIRKGLTWIVKDGKHTQKIVGSDALFKEGVQINPNIEKLVVEYNREHGLIAVDDLPDSLTDRTQQLIKIYQTATTDERKAFRIWLVEQEMK